MELIEILKNLLYALLGIGVVGGGLVYMTGAGTFPTSTPEITPFPVNPELVEFYTAACDAQVFTNQNKSLNTVGYLISNVSLNGSADTFNYTTMTRATNDWSRWSAGALQNTSYYCYIHVVQNELYGVTNYYFNFTRNQNNNLLGDVTWSSGTKSGTYNYRSLTITGPVSLTANTTINALENVTITGAGQLTINSASPQYTLTINARDFINQGRVIGDGATGASGSGWYGYQWSYDCYAFCSNAGNGYNGATIVFSGKTFNNTGIISLNGGAGGNQPAVCGGYACYGGGSHFCRAGTGGTGGTIIFNTTKVTFINAASGTINLNAGSGGNGASCCYYTAVGSDAGNGGLGGTLNTTNLNFTSAGQINTNGGNGGSSSCVCWQCGNGGNGGNGGTNNISVFSNISVTQLLSSAGGSGGSSPGGCGCSGGSGGSSTNWIVPYCANGTGMDWTKFIPGYTRSSISCLVPPTTSFVVPNSTTSLLTLSNNLTSALSTGAPELAYRYQLSLDNGSTWIYVTEAVAAIPVYFNNSTNFDVYLMNASPTALMRVMAYNNTSNVFGEWTNSQEFYLLNRNTTLLNATTPDPITSIPFTVYCNYTSNGTVLQDAATRVYIDGVAYDASYDFTTQLYEYTWPGSTFLASGNHSFSCWANKGNFNLAQSANISFSLGGFAVYYAGGNGTRFFCPFPTYLGAYPAYQTAGKGAIRVQNFNVTNLKNYTAYLRYVQPTGMIVYGRCDKLSPAAAGWVILSDTLGYQCWNNINATNVTAYMWLKGDCVGATPGSYNVPEIVIIDSTP